MNRADYLLLISAAVALTFSAAYYFQPPAPRYYPVEHAWKMEHEKGVPSMGWYGRTAWGLAAGTAAGALTALGLLAVPRDANGHPRRLPAWLGTSLSLLVLVVLVALAAQIMHHEFHKWGTYQPWQLPGS